ncbi:hypothetical protein [Nocardia abscessus]|uniref:hypothetical protein n=1 Tax=Nocardia abscessus TaxID=120957 RepID=UPI0024553BEC|nr:hypothetical protein [Nocardia abscessus]
MARALVGAGSADDAAGALTAHLDAGADHVVVQVLADTPSTDPPRPTTYPTRREVVGGP